MNIEIIKSLKERAKEMLEDNYDRKIGDEEIYTIICELENFYTAYEKEKEKNKTLEELLQGRLFELYKYYKDLASEYQANCISKNKIKPIQIIDLDGKIHNVYKIEEE